MTTRNDFIRYLDTKTKGELMLRIADLTDQPDMEQELQDWDKIRRSK